MKGLFFIVAGLFLFSVPVFGELSVEDLEKICQIVSESEVQLEKRFSAEIRAQGERFSTEIRAQGERITELGKHLDLLATEQGKRLDFHSALRIALIVAIIAFVGAPLGFIPYQYNKYLARHDAEMKALREKIEMLERNQILRA